MTNSSPSRIAFVPREARSLPAFGSEKPWHQISSPERIFARCRPFWLSVPMAMRVGPTRERPIVPMRCGALARASSSWKMACCISVAPRPPYCRGQEMPAHPPSKSVRCQRLR